MSSLRLPLHFRCCIKHLRGLQSLHRLQPRHYSSADLAVPHCAVVGSGPAGFYTAQQILKGHPTAIVDIYEKLPVPFGLVRYGVAPDHPEVKNVINTFTSTANNKRCNFIGNVTVGQDISLQDLRNTYTAVVLAYGSEDDKKFGIPGEDLSGVFSARKFVGWYNGLPEDRELKISLDTDTVTVLGQGNVALDVARVLLTPVDILKKTDITEYALATLNQSRIKRVYLIGRRGPLQVAFTTAELREMVRLPGTRPVLNKADFEEIQPILKDLPRPRKRLVELMVKTALSTPSEADAKRWTNAEREWHLKFLRSPLEFLPSQDGSQLAGIRLSVNELQGNYTGNQSAKPTGETENLECGLAFRSIGYKMLPLEGAPYDANKAVIPNKAGKVFGEKGLYCSGWVKRGPVGVIVSTMNDSFETGKMVLDDFANGQLVTSPDHQGLAAVLPALKEKGINPVLFSDWENIDHEEIQRGNSIGKPREKITDIDQMLEVAHR